MGPKSIRPERVAPNPPEKPNEEEKPEERAEDADGKDEFEMTPPPFIPNLAEMSEFARSFYNAGGVHAGKISISFEKVFSIKIGLC